MLVPPKSSSTSYNRPLPKSSDTVNPNQHGFDFGNERKQIGQPIRGAYHHDDCDACREQFLLILQIAVDREENLESGVCQQSKQFAVLLSRPTHFDCGTKYVSRNLTDESSQAQWLSGIARSAS